MPERLTIKVRTNRPKTEIIEEQDGIIILAVHAPPLENKANLEIIRFFHKRTGKQVRIVSGHTSKQKVIALD